MDPNTADIQNMQALYGAFARKTQPMARALPPRQAIPAVRILDAQGNELPIPPSMMKQPNTFLPPAMPLRNRRPADLMKELEALLSTLPARTPRRRPTGIIPIPLGQGGGIMQNMPQKIGNKNIMTLLKALGTGAMVGAEKGGLMAPTVADAFKSKLLR